MLHRILRRLGASALAGVAALLAVGGIMLVSGEAAVVTTDGVSMNPVYYDGDLVVLRRASAYSVGQIVAYHLPAGNDVVLHRIIGGDPDGFVIKGDNNPSIDTVNPAAQQLIGHAVLHLPQGGAWLERLTTPPMLALAAFALVAGGGTAITRGKRKRKRTAMSRHIRSGSSSLMGFGSFTPSLRAAAGASLIVAIMGAALAGISWTSPLTQVTNAEANDATKMHFSYTADVGRSAAYDKTVAESPNPVFRNLTNMVEVAYLYEGEPGTVSVTGELSTPEGWHSTIALMEPTEFSGHQYEGAIELDLNAFEAKAAAAAKVTGLPAGPLSIAITPHVSTISGQDFRPTLNLNMTPLQLSIAGEAKDLTVTGSSSTAQSELVPRTVALGGWHLSVETVRKISAALLASALLIGAVVVLLARRNNPMDEVALIHQRYAGLLVPVHPMSAAEGRRVIEVTAFATLAKLAERYGLLVLHWTQSGIETFIVQDDSITYRYRAGANSSVPEPAPPLIYV